MLKLTLKLKLMLREITPRDFTSAVTRALLRATQKVGAECLHFRGLVYGSRRPPGGRFGHTR